MKRKNDNIPNKIFLKNTILLTVIAIATLLVAVVGATFAYFTANVTTKNDSYNKTEVTTKAFATATFDYGSEVSTSDDDVYPGYTWVKKLNVEGSGDAGSEPLSLTLTMLPSGLANFAASTGDDSVIEYKLYKSSTEITVSNTCQGEVAGLTETYKCTANVQDNSQSPVASGTFKKDNTAVTYDIENITNTTNDDYYLVVTYKDTGAPQNTQQGQTFSVQLSVAQKSA